MSFYSNRDRVGPGLIEGSPLEGLCNRVVISCKRVLDSCKKQLSMENTRLVMRDVTPGIAPTTFVGGINTHTEATVTNLQVTRLEERPCFARIRCNVHVPLEISFLCAEGDKHYAASEIVVPEDIILYVPEASVFPFEIQAVASVSFTTGKFDGNDLLTTACVTIITKVVAETDLLVPAYGYFGPNECVDYQEQVCNRFFELPLYPSGK